MKTKTIKVKIQQTTGGLFRIEQITNTIHLISNGKQLKVGDFLEDGPAQILCESKHYEVTVNAVRQ